MEISERELRQLVDAVDEQHRDGMRTMAADIGELHAATRRFRTSANAGTSRRQLLTTAAAGAGVIAIGSAVLALPSLFTAVAAAQEAPKLDDEDIAAFSESVELAAVMAYKLAASSGKLSAPVVQAGTTFAGHHDEHAMAFAGEARGKATGKANAKLVDAIGGQLQEAHDEKAVLQIALDLENAASATYLFALGAFERTSALQLAATILPVESQHAVVIGQALGKAVADYVPNFENQDRALDPAKFPLTTTTTTTSTTSK
jgi:hypothetical protein